MPLSALDTPTIVFDGGGNPQLSALDTPLIEFAGGGNPQLSALDTPVLVVNGGTLPQLSALDTMRVPISGENNFTFGQIVGIEVIRATANLLTFGQILNVSFNVPASSLITFGQDVQSNTFFEFPVTAITFGSQVNNEYNISVGNTITFDSIGADAAIKVTASTPIVFDQTAVGNKIFNRSLSSLLTFVDLTFVKDLNFDLDNQLVFGQIVLPNSILNIAVGNTILFAVGVKTVIDAVAENLITFNSSVARGEDPVSGFVFGQAVVVAVTSRANSQINFNQILARSIILNVSVGNLITFGNRGIGVSLDGCDLHEYTPAGSQSSLVSMTSPVSVAAANVILQCTGIGDLILRNPDFSNNTGVEPDRVYARSRGGTLGSFRDQTWPKDRLLTISFSILKVAKRDEVEAFLKFCLGKLVTYTDMETRKWDGIILNPTTAIVQETISKHTVTIEMSATPQ